MIHVIGDSTTSEYNAAVELRRIILHSWPTLMTASTHQIWIIAGAKCHGQTKRDIDILLLTSFGSKLTYHPFLSFYDRDQLEKPHEVRVKSLCAAIEVKDHPPEKVCFVGSRTQVYYKEGWKDVTEQNEQQRFSVKNFVEHHGYTSPWVVPLIWLRNVPTVDLPDLPHNILGSNLTWDYFLNIMGQMHPPRRTQDGWLLSCATPEVISKIAELFTKPLEPTNLDRRRMELASQRAMSEPALINLVGQKTVILRGGGGTGKTLRLLQLAKQLYDEQDARVLILTYNRALVADIGRLLTFMGIGDDIVEHSIQMQTVHSFFYAALSALGIIRSNSKSFLENYEELKDEALAYFITGVLSQADVEKLRLSTSEAFTWDYLFIDEGQDWPQNEQELLLHLYPYNRFVIAEGIDQLIRSSTPANWKERLRATPPHLLSLKTCIRMKAGLARFVTSFTLNLGLPQPNWQANPETPGGHVIILEGDYLSNRGLHDSLLSHNAKNGNEPVDLLFCVSHRLVRRLPESEKVYSLPGRVFRDWGYQVWDGASMDVRESYPTELGQLRIVQYDSCRGLEGWTVVNMDFDGFYFEKRDRYLSLPQNETLSPSGEPLAAHLYAARWALIPLTRAIDTLVVQISGQPNRVREALLAATGECRDIVEWQ